MKLARVLKSPLYEDFLGRLPSPCSFPRCPSAIRAHRAHPITAPQVSSSASLLPKPLPTALKQHPSKCTRDGKWFRTLLVKK